MYDLREHKELISQLVSEANQNDENWRWSVKSVGKEKARIFWSIWSIAARRNRTSASCWRTPVMAAGLRQRTSMARP